MNIGRLISIALLSVAMLVHGAKAGELDQARANGVLRLLWVRDSAPFSFDKNGQPAGYAVDLCSRVAALIAPGLKIQWQATALDKGLTAISQSKADLLCGPLTITLGRLSQMDFTSPILIGGPGVILRPDASPILAQWLDPQRAPTQSLRVLQLDSAQPQRVAVLRGSTGSAWLQDVIKQNDLSVTVFQVPNDDAAIKLLKAGEVDAWVGEWAVLASRAATDHDLRNYQVISRSFSGEPLALAMPPDPQLYAAVEAALAQVIRGPDFRTLLTGWFGPEAGADAVVIRSVTPLE